MRYERIALGAVVLAVAVAVPRMGQAQTQRSFDMNLFKLAPGNGSFLTVEGADVPSGFSWFAGGMFDYQYRSVLIKTCREQEEGGCIDWGGEQAALVEHHLSVEVAGGVSFMRVFEAAVVLPVVLYQAGEGVEGATSVQELSGNVGLGDLRLHLKLDLLHGVFRVKDDTFGLALVPVLSFPTGRLVHSDSLMGDSLVTVHTKLAFSASVGRFRFGFDVGYLWREDKTFYLADMSHRFTYGAAMEVKIVAPLYGIVEFIGQNGFSKESASSPLEVDAGIRYRFPVGLTLTAGAGAGIVAGVGTPAFRIFFGLMFSPPRVGEPVDEDRDGDGIVNAMDECPDEAEDRDDFKDGDGCPDPDNDQDGFLDDDDQCPDDPEDVDEFQDDDGCPDLDDDQDGILDGDDECPADPEDEDGFEDGDGCPDLDNDEDGILDDDDQCPDDPEDVDEFQDDDGCPDPDNDQDGVPDEKDECPLEKEVINGFEDKDGCPDEGKAILSVSDNQLVLMENINFATDSAKIIGDESFKILDAVLGILEDNPGMKLRIEGHTDSKGALEHNMDLSKRRAESVKNYLVEHGIDPERLETEGLGPTVPIADNKTKKGRARNRRVEFHIIQD